MPTNGGQMKWSRTSRWVSIKIPQICSLELIMRYDVFFAGYGGQGVLLAGNLLSYAAIHEGENVSFFPAYGVEKRGGSAMCTVVFSDGDTGSPVVGNPSVSVILNQLSFDKYAAKVKQGRSEEHTSELQ